MGNLYTHIVRRPDPRLSILSELKREWRNRPRDRKKIRQLQKELHETDKPKKIHLDSFGNPYKI